MPKTNEFGINRMICPLILLLEDNKSDEYKKKVKEVIDYIGEIIDPFNSDKDFQIICYMMGSENQKSSDKLENFIEFNCLDFFDKTTINLSNTIKILDGDMSKKVLFNGSVKYAVPIVILIADDKTNYKRVGNDLLMADVSSRWLKLSRKIVIHTEKNVNHKNIECFKEFCGSEEGCIRYENIYESLRILLKFFCLVSTGIITQVNQESKFVDVDPVIEEIDDSLWIDDTVWNDDSWD